MTPQEAIITLRLRLNKSHSSDYDNIPDWVAVEAIRKATIQVLRRTIHGKNPTQEGDEETRLRVDDLQNLLTTQSLGTKNRSIYYESDSLPKDYLWYKSLVPYCSNKTCSKNSFKSMLVEEANVPNYLKDWSMKPSFEWRETFHTLAGNKIRIYTNGEFSVDRAVLTYYRKPNDFDIHGYTHPDGSDSQNVDLEFKIDVCGLILDEAASVIAGDVELVNQYTTNKTATQTDD